MSTPGPADRTRFYDGPDAYYAISSCMVHRYVREPDGGWRSERSWYFEAPDLPPPVAAWVHRFWSSLAGPSFLLEADQWASEYLTVLDGQVYSWRDDRHECSYYLNSVTPLADFQPPSDAAREWLQRLGQKP